MFVSLLNGKGREMLRGGGGGGGGRRGRGQFLTEIYCSTMSKLFPLTHRILVDFSTVICWTSSLVILGVSVLFCGFYSVFDVKSCEQTM